MFDLPHTFTTKITMLMEEISVSNPYRLQFCMGVRRPFYHFLPFFGSKVVQKVEASLILLGKMKITQKRGGIVSPPVFNFKTPNYISQTAQKASAVREIIIKSIGDGQTDKQFGQGLPPNGHLIFFVPVS